jgi:selenocysteine lyase/cysteine desulfurase
MAPLQAFAQSLKIFLEIGPDVVSKRILDRAEAVREIARSAGWSVYGSTRPEDLSGIVAFEKAGVDHETFAMGLRERGIALACRRGRVRVSPHIYNNADDLGRLAEALARPSV